MSHGLLQTNLSQQVADRLRAWVREGRYQPGDRLPTFKQLAAELGVGVSSVREAMRSLEMIGLVSIRHGQGIFITESVKVLTESLTTMVAMKRLHLRTIYEARLVVETGAGMLASQRASRDELDSMARLLADLADPGITPSQRVEIDQAFHRVMLQASGNPVLAETGRTLLEALRDDMEYALNLGQMVMDHQHILDALRARDAAAVRAALEAHLTIGLKSATAVWTETADPTREE